MAGSALQKNSPAKSTKTGRSKPTAKSASRKTTKKSVSAKKKSAAPDLLSNESESVVTLPEQLRIGQTSALKRELAKLFASKTKIYIDASKLKKIDTSGLQLLAAFAIKAKAESIPLNWKSPGESLMAAAELLNLTEYLGLAEKKTLRQTHYATR